MIDPSRFHALSTSDIRRQNSLRAWRTPEFHKTKYARKSREAAPAVDARLDHAVRACHAAPPPFRPASKPRTNRKKYGSMATRRRPDIKQLDCLDYWRFIIARRFPAIYRNSIQSIKRPCSNRSTRTSLMRLPETNAG
nr:hypothetical protein [Burkholderia pseudomallei]